MKYIKKVNIWDLNEEQRKGLQIGQWVYAGENDFYSTGIWCGQKTSGVAVVAWLGNMQGRKNPQEYLNKLIQYAKG